MMATRFEPLVLDPCLGAVAQNGKQRRITRKATEVLLLLTGAAGRVVTKEELIAAAWGGLAVTDEVLTTAIYELRRALGDDARTPRFIETVRKSGYRWIGGPVRHETFRPIPAARAGWGRRWSRWTAGALLAAAALVTAPDPKSPPGDGGSGPSGPVASEACTLYLKGLQVARQGTRSGAERGLEYLRQAAEQDPRFAAAQVALADAYGGAGAGLLGLSPSQAYLHARRAALRALEIDPDLATAHAALASLRFRYAWDWQGAERGFVRARSLATCERPDVDRRYAEYLSAMGRHGEAIAALREFVAGSPLSVEANWSLGRTLYLARRYDAALAQLAATLDLDPHHPATHGLLGEVHSRLGHQAEAFEAWLQEARLLGASPASLVRLEEAFRASRLDGVRRWRLKWTAASSLPRDPVREARLLAELGEVAPALVALRRAYQERRSELVWVGTEPAFDSIRREPEFDRILRSMGLEPRPAGLIES